jgi:hypothetical protein
VSETEVTQQISPEIEQAAAPIARDRARNARWDLNIAVFLFAILILVIILGTYTKAGLEVVASVSTVGLALVWMTGRRREKQLYQRFYEEEISRLEREQNEAVKIVVNKTIEETIEERVQKALRDRWR